MSLLILAYLGGVLTILSPCILPILPFVFARAERPFVTSTLPMLIGLALAFAAVASLGAVAGGWAIAASQYGRIVALAVMTLFGLMMLTPNLASRLAAPIVSIGNKLLNRHGQTAKTADMTAGASILLGVATALVWAPCAGPILGLVLTGAALHGPGTGTYLLLVAYGLGTATSLSAAMILGRRLLGATQHAARWSDGLRRLLGAAVLAGVALIAFGLDTGLLTRLSLASTTNLEQRLISTLRTPPAMAQGAVETIVTPAAAPAPALSTTLAALLGTSQWLNTPALRADDLRGKVVLVNFWTYSCINCLRVLPHVRDWAAKYHDQGLVVIGVHTPEFAFEKDVANVRTALTSLGVSYPVAIDNDFGIWQAFNNDAWPALYFIGADGHIRDQAIGEGNYDQSERLIQQLLSEAKGTVVTKDITTINGAGPQAAADERDLYSGETYIGYTEGSHFASPGGVNADVPSLYRGVPALSLNRWSLAGTWTIGGEFATSKDPSGKIAYRFHARDLHLVLGPSVAGKPIRFRVTIDGSAPGANHGSDTNAAGLGHVQDHRLYQMVRQTGPVAEHTFEIEFLDPGVQAYAFTFG